ncbi:MAG: hypothetical protein F6J95_016665 [Leptolyngbya sp. SIO1E4]|nr:hypothetical protein [Leptolyngbya sp. SIO1E4]
MKRRLAQLGLEFWLPLPLIAAGFWLGAHWLNHQVMGYPYEPTTQFTSTPEQPQISLSLSLTIASIDAEIDQDDGTTEVTIQTIGNALQELEFEYPFVEFAQIEAAIVQELNLSPEVVRAMIRYRIDH